MKLRRVMFKKWIPRETIGEGALQTQKEGTNCWESDFVNEGLLYRYACPYEVFENGQADITWGVINLANGTIEQVLPINIKFVDLTSY